MARILIADDEEAIRDLVKEVLSAEKHEFLLAENGAQALELLRSKGADLAIIDLTRRWTVDPRRRSTRSRF